MKPIPLVSVIIPVYNEAPYLREAIESVLHQSYVYWELLLVDDGSTDGSAATALEYAQSFPHKIRYLSHPEKKIKGLSASRRLGLKEAKGEYLALLNAGNYWLPEKLAHQVAIAKEYPEAAMICGASVYWYSWANNQKEDATVKVGAPQNQLLKPPLPATALYPLGKGEAPCPCSILVKREVALRYDGYEGHFNGKNQLYNDHAFFIKIYLHEPIYISSKAMDRYRQRNDSIITRTEQQENNEEVRLAYLNWLKKYLTDKGITDKKVWKKYNAALLSYKRPVLYKIMQLIKKK